jgi:hypothetical protein
MPTFADRGCHVVSVTDPNYRILGFLARSRYFFYQVAPQLYSRGWVDPVPDSLLLWKCGSAGNRIRTSGCVASNSNYILQFSVKARAREWQLCRNIVLCILFMQLSVNLPWTNLWLNWNKISNKSRIKWHVVGCNAPPPPWWWNRYSSRNTQDDGHSPT